MKEKIVISAVNIRKGGTLTVLRECLGFLSTKEGVQVTAIVHDRRICDYDGISYIEIPWSMRSWIHRLWCEYVTLHRISERMDGVDLWLSLHDISPRVKAGRRAVYCHTSFPFMKRKWQDWRFDPKIPLFSLLMKYAYRINVRRNKYLIVQQEWFRDAMAALVHFPKDRIIVAPPAFRQWVIPDCTLAATVPIFLYPATADCHKNFETLCEAMSLLAPLCKGPSLYNDKRMPLRVVLTIDGTENSYARYLKKKYGHLKCLDFHGFMSREELRRYYGLATCLVFPSRVETWGLPISEFKHTGKPMLLADLPYAHETAAGAGQVAFFPPDDALSLAALIAQIADFSGNSSLHPCKDAAVPSAPFAADWDALFKILLADGKAPGDSL